MYKQGSYILLKLNRDTYKLRFGYILERYIDPDFDVLYKVIIYNSDFSESKWIHYLQDREIIMEVI